MAIKDVIFEVQQLWREVGGIASAPDTPPENAADFPFAVTYERQGVMRGQSFGWGLDFLVILSELHVSQAMFQEGILLAQSKKDDFLLKFIEDPTLNTTISTVREVRYTFGRLEWNGVQTIGYRLEIDCKVSLQV